MTCRYPKTTATLLPLLGLINAQATLAAEETSSGTLAEVVVTATKQGATAAQETPLALSVLSSADLDAANIEGVNNLVLKSPGLVYGENEQRAQIFIRGVGSNLVALGTDPSSAVYLDGVYLARPYMAFADFLNLDRIEVLRGPQGTLYGRNSAGGAVNIITREPSDILKASIAAEYGSYNKRKIAGTLSGPLLEDSLLGSISLLKKVSDGFVRNVNSPGSPSRLNDDDMIGARGSLHWLAGDRVNVYLSGDYANAHDHAIAGKALIKDVFGNPIVGPGVPELIPDPYTVSLTPGSAVDNETTTWGITGRITVDLAPGMQLSSISAYRDSESRYAGLDADYTHVDAFDAAQRETHDQFSQELQLTATSGRLKWLVGLYYFEEQGALLAPIGLTIIQPGLESVNDAKIKTDAWAAYVNGTYALTDRLSVTAGARYSYEKKQSDAKGYILFDGVNPGFGGYTSVGSATFNAWTPKFGIDYRWTDDVMLYASATRGFKSGGFNIGADQPSFDPEYIWAYEVGLKSDWFDRRLRANLSAFFYEYTDLQVQQNQEASAGAVSIVLRNAANATLKGFELELEALPMASLHLSANVAYLDATYDDFVTARTNAPGIDVDVSGNTMTMAPKWAFGVSASYDVNVADRGTLSFSAGYKWQDDVFFTPFNDAGNRQRAYGLLNAQVGFTTSDDRWQFAVFGTNLTDEAYYTNTQDFSPFGVVGFITERRLYGGKVVFNY